jgi:hypothetical protein
MFPAANVNVPGGSVSENISVVSGSGETESTTVESASGVTGEDGSAPSCTVDTKETFSNFTVDPEEPEVPIAVAYGSSPFFQIPFPSIHEDGSGVTTWTPNSSGVQFCPGGPGPDPFTDPDASVGIGGCSAPNGSVRVTDLTHISGTCDNNDTASNGFDFDKSSVTYDLTLSPTADSERLSR